MSDIVTQLRLAEKAAEDIYSAKVSRELIEALHKRAQAEEGAPQPTGQSGEKTGQLLLFKSPRG